MTGKRIGGVMCLVLAVVLLVGGIMRVTGEGPAVADGSGLGVGYAVASFLPFLLALTVGLWLLQKPKSK